MGEKNNDQSIMDKSMRSVFGKYKIHIFLEFFFTNVLVVMFPIQLVGNIPYEATEEKLKEIFSEVGPVLSLK